MSSKTDLPRAAEAAHDAVDTRVGARRPTRARLLRAAAAFAAGTLALGGVALARSAPSAAPQTAALAAAAQLGPMIPARAHHITRATIGLFTVTPARLPAAGGSVRLVAVVSGATSCRFSSTTALAHLPANAPCGSGNVSMSVRVPKNTGGAARSFRFQLTAKGANSHVSAGPVTVTQSARPSGHGVPQITTQPTGRGVLAGAKVSFSAAASGATGVHWQLSSDGAQHWSNVPGATSSTYSFSATLARSGDEYRAVFTNAAGSTHTKPATLTVTSAPASSGGPAAVAPAVTLQPKSQDVAVGAAVTFTAAASGAPAPGVQWQLSSDGGQSWSAISGATSVSYAVTAQLALSGYDYRAVFANSSGTAVTAAATLTVSQAPSVTTQPASQSVPVGTQATFSAAAAGSPAPSVQWQSSGDGGQTWTSIPGATSGTYSVTPSSTGTILYEAVFANAAGTATTSAATLTVTQTAQAPAVTLSPASQTVAAGTAATFTAGASGSPTPSVQWWVSTNGGASWLTVSGATSTTYTLTAQQSESGYEFEAIFSNGTGSPATTSPAVLTVDTPPSITANPSPQSVPANGTASFSAGASGVPAPGVQWQVSTDGSTWANVPSGGTTATYSFTATSAQNGDFYRAQFTNAVGTAFTTAAQLTVIASPTPPAITGQPANAAVVNGEDASFTASASGAPTPTVQWWVSMNGGSNFSPISGATNTTYSFVTSSSENGYEYEAVFTNSAGNATTSAATLVVGADATSLNWSGYVATGPAGSFTTVTGTWNVATAICPGPVTYSSSWVGIDGDTSTTVEQDGTDSDCTGTTPSYYAWYETYGPSSTNPPIAGGNSEELPPNTYPVAAGDSMTGTVSASGSTYTFTLHNNTRGWTSSIAPVTWSVPTKSSVEWIVERPSVGGSLASLTNFGTETFTASGATESGSPVSIAGTGASALEMTNNAGTGLLALPGSLAGGGQGFTDTFYASS